MVDGADFPLLQLASELYRLLIVTGLPIISVGMVLYFYRRGRI